MTNFVPPPQTLRGDMKVFGKEFEENLFPKRFYLKVLAFL